MYLVRKNIYILGSNSSLLNCKIKSSWIRAGWQYLLHVPVRKKWYRIWLKYEMKCWIHVCCFKLHVVLGIVVGMHSFHFLLLRLTNWNYEHDTFSNVQWSICNFSFIYFLFIHVLNYGYSHVSTISICLHLWTCHTFPFPTFPSEIHIKSTWHPWAGEL